MRPDPAEQLGVERQPSHAARLRAANRRIGARPLRRALDRDPAADEVDVPTEVDFETDAQAKISEKNLEAELKAVEQELAL